MKAFIRLDVWGGELSQEFLASRDVEFTDANWVDAVRSELAAGFLVNLRVLAVSEEPSTDVFDARVKLQ